MSKKTLFVVIGICITAQLIVAGCTSAENTTGFVSTTTSTMAEITTTTAPNSKENDMQRAHAALTNFFTLMHEGEYGEATKYYGGSYEVLQNWNPPVDKNDHTALLKAACEGQLRCLPIRRIVLEKQSSHDMFEFTAEFTAPNGGLFVRGPFPGENKDQAVSRFSYIVKKVGGSFLVQDLPPYVP